MPSTPRIVCGVASAGAKSSVLPRCRIRIPTRRGPAAAATCSISVSGTRSRIPARTSPRPSPCGSSPIPRGAAPMRSGRHSTSWNSSTSSSTACAHSRALVRNREVIEPLRENTRTLADHYRRKLARHSLYRRTVTDHLLERVFTAEKSRAQCAPRQHLPARARTAPGERSTMRELGAERYSVEQILRMVVDRAEKLRSMGARQPPRCPAPRALDGRLPNALVCAG